MTLFKPKWKRNGKRTEGRYWWVDTTVNGTRVRRSLEVADKRAAQMKEAEIIRGLELKAAGLDTHGESADTTLDALVGEYERELVRRRSSPTHTTHTTMRIRALLAKAHRLTDVTPAFVRKALSREQTSRDLSARTVNGYRVALSGLFAWLVQEGRWETNPVQQVKRVREAESKRQRRALDDEELAALLDCAEPDRALCYLVAVTTGLRRSELAALRWADIDLERATARVRASTSKNRKEAWQPLPPSVVQALAKADRDGGLVFQRVPTTKQLREDLSAANVPYTTADGVADLHSLRVTYATRLAKAGVSLVQAQKLMRHSDPKLTANIYTRLRMDDAHAAVARIDVA